MRRQLRSQPCQDLAGDLRDIFIDPQTARPTEREQSSDPIAARKLALLR